MSRLHRGYAVAALGLAILTFVVSLSLFPEWRQSPVALISLAVVAVVGAVAFIAALRQAVEHQPAQSDPNKSQGGAGFGGDANFDGDLISHDKIVNVYQSSAPASFPFQLSPPPPDFTGREAELKELLANFDKGAAISGLRGMGGVGKTALARRLAAELAPRYDIALYANFQRIASRNGKTDASRQNPFSRSGLPIRWKKKRNLCPLAV